MDILWPVFHILTEPLPYTFASVNRRNNEAMHEQCGPALHHSVDLRIQTSTQPVPFICGKLATKYPWICGYFCTVCIYIYVLTGVHVGVFLHVGLLVEALAAERAGERADVVVDEQVSAQRRRSLEPLLTDAAPERPCCRRLSRRPVFGPRSLRRPRWPAVRHRQSARTTRTSARAVVSGVADTRDLSRTFRFLVHRVEKRIPDFRSGPCLVLAGRACRR